MAKPIGRVSKWLGLVLLAALLVWAWLDGGREPVRLIEHSVSLPEGL